MLFIYFMKINYLDINWTPVGKRTVANDYQFPDKIVSEYRHIAQLIPEEKFSFLDNIHVSPVEDIVENIYSTKTMFFFHFGKSLQNHFNISLFFEKIECDLSLLANILNMEMIEYIEHDESISKNNAGIEIDIIGIDYGMVYFNVPNWNNNIQSVAAIMETAKKLDHYFFSILKEIKIIGKGIVPLIPSYAHDQKKVKIFISHSSKDKKFARELRDSFHSENIDTWFDEDDILVGDDFVESMEKGLKESDFIVIVLSPNFSTGPWAKKEYRTALTEQINKGIIKILPIKHIASEVPAMLNSISHADFSVNYDDGLKILLRSIRMRYYKEKSKEKQKI